MDRPSAGGFLGLTALQAEGCGGGFAADYKVSVTGFAFSVIWYDNHSADWPAALASPYPAAPDCPRLRGKGGGASHQRGGCIFNARRAVEKVLS